MRLFLLTPDFVQMKYVLPSNWSAWFGRCPLTIHAPKDQCMVDPDEVMLPCMFADESFSRYMFIIHLSLCTCYVSTTHTIRASLNPCRIYDQKLCRIYTSFNCTNSLQTLDIIINNVFKCHLKSEYNTYCWRGSTRLVHISTKSS